MAARRAHGTVVTAMPVSSNEGEEGVGGEGGDAKIQTHHHQQPASMSVAEHRAKCGLRLSVWVQVVPLWIVGSAAEPASRRETGMTIETNPTRQPNTLSDWVMIGRPTMMARVVAEMISPMARFRQTAS